MQELAKKSSRRLKMQNSNGLISLPFLRRCVLAVCCVHLHLCMAFSVVPRSSAPALSMGRNYFSPVSRTGRAQCDRTAPRMASEVSARVQERMNISRFPYFSLPSEFLTSEGLTDCERVTGVLRRMGRRSKRHS